MLRDRVNFVGPYKFCPICTCLSPDNFNSIGNVRRDIWRVSEFILFQELVTLYLDITAYIFFLHKILNTSTIDIQFEFTADVLKYLKKVVI